MSRSCVDPKLVLNGLGEVSPGDLMQILEQRLETPDDEGEDRNGEDLIPRLREPPSGQKRRFLLDHGVEGDTDENRWGEVEQLVED